MRSRLWLLLWLLGILFPMAFLARLWPSFGRVFNLVFAPDWMHTLMHAFLYAVLAVLLSHWFHPNSIQAVLSVLGLVLLIGIIQEGLQLLSQGRWPGWAPELFDLGIDVAGAGFGMLAIYLLSRRRAAS